MRLPLNPSLSTKDGVSNRNARLTNCLKESSKTGDKAVIRPGLEEVTATLSASNGNGIVSFNDDLLSVFGTNLAIADVSPHEVVSFPVIEVLDSLPLTYSGEEEAYPTAIVTGANEEDYSDIVVVGWGIGPNMTQGYESNYYIFRWEESLGYEVMDIEPTFGLSYDFREAALVSDDGETIFMTGIVEPSTKIKIYKWTRLGGVVELGPDALVGDDPGNLSGRTRSLACTPDGLCCVGTFRPLTGSSRGFKWTAIDGFVDLDSLKTESYANDVSDDGSVIAGIYAASSISYAAKWTTVGGWVSLGSLGGNGAGASYISADGTIICGLATNVSVATRAFKWTQAGGMVDLDVASLYTNIDVLAMSRDGSTIVGLRTIAATGVQYHPYMWTEAGGFVSLVYPSETNGYATSVSDDGSVIVGSSVVAGVKIAWKWTAETGMVSLGTAGTYDYEAYHVSADGTAITGNAWATADTYPIYPFVLGGTDVLPRFRSLVDLADVPMDFAQSTL